MSNTVTILKKILTRDLGHRFKYSADRQGYIRLIEIQNETNMELEVRRRSGIVPETLLG